MERADFTDIFEMEKVFEDLPSSFVSTLKRHRKRLKMSQEDLAESSNLSVSTISRIERKEKMPTTKDVMALCIGLKLKFEYSMDMFEKSKHSGIFLVKDMETLVYRKILLYEGIYNISEINEMLIENELNYLVIGE